MKNLYLIVLMVLVGLTASAQNFFLEDFNACGSPADWATTIVTGDDPWLFGDNAAGTPAGTVDGTCMAYFDDDELTGAAAFSTVDLTSPIIDLSSLDTGLLQFDYIFEDLGTSFFAVALWNGTAWDTVFTENTDPGCFGFFPACGPRSASIDLTGYLNADFQANFIFDDGDGWNWFIGLDNVTIYVPPAKDAVAVEELAPESACGLSAAELISLVIFNNGQADITSINAGFEVGAQMVSETFTITIPIGESDTLNFLTPVDMSAGGSYDFAVWTELTGDEDATNDTIWFSRENIPVISSLPYSEGFESGNGFWNVGGTGSSWALGTPGGTVISQANNGSNAWVTNLDGAYANNENSYVESPCMDFSALAVDPVFRFAHIFNTEDCCDEGFVEITIDGGTTWTRLGAAGEGLNWYDDAANNEWDGDGVAGNGSAWRNAEHILDGTAGQAEVRIRIHFSSDGSIAAEGFGFDDVEIFEFPSVNAGVTEILSPLNGCALGTSSVTVVFENTGLEFVEGFELGYNVGAGAVTQTILDTLFVGEIDTVTFDVDADLSVIGDYNVSAWTSVAGDGDVGNDSSFVIVSNIPVISTLPYMEDFESGAGGWTSGQIATANTWELGLPTNTFIDTANSGINAWVTDLDGLYLVNEESFVESPCMDFSGLSVDPVFRFAILGQSEANWDGAWVEVSTDAGQTWAVLGNVGEGTNWYNNDDFFSTIPQGWDGENGTPGNWLTATHLIDGAAGESSVKIRVRFSADGSFTEEGFAFDDIEIFEQPSINAGVTEILSPVSGCGLGTELVTVVLENFGDADLVDFNVEYDAGAGVVSELITDTLFAASVDTFTFTVPVDLSVEGNYDFGAWTAVVGDGDLLNDSLFTSIFNSPVISSLPYMEDFEAGAGGWYATGENGIWELGDPEGLLIDTAASGVNAWATNLDSLNYGLDQLSYLVSPCFDLSTLTIDPILEFGLISNSETGWDGAYLESSTDGGATWDLVGNVGEGTNWYTNDAFFVATINQGWDGNTADTVGWVTAEHLLDGVAGSSDVIIRFVFDSDDLFSFEGFGIDDIVLTEQPAINSEVTAIVSPESGCDLTATEALMVHVTNLGSEVMDSVIIGYTFDNGAPMTEIFDNSVGIGVDTIFTLTNTLDLSTFGDYELVVWTGTIDDGDTSNDTMSVVVTSIPTISTLPYMEMFENGSGGWTSGGVNSSWELGEPEGVFIDTANSGINAWVTNLTGVYNNDEVSFVESPCIDFSALTDDPVLSFAGIFNTENGIDEGFVEVSIDGGTTYTKLGLAGEGTNWYNNTFDNSYSGISGAANEWLIAEHIIDGTAGESDVKIRFVFDADFSITNEGFGLDDISIFAQPELDLVALSFDGPNGNCELGMEEVSMTFWNKGLMAVSNFNLGFIVDAGAPQTEVYTNTVNSGDTVSYTFTTEMADLSIFGAHTIDVFTALASDERLESDSLLGNIVTNYDETALAQTEMPESAISSTIVEGTTSEMFFCGLPTSLDGCLGIESVTIDSISHTFLSDLDIFLISPAGDTVELSTDNGGGFDNLSNVTFSDTSTNDITLQIEDIVPGIYATEDADGFAGLYNGQDPNGAWSLFIQDDAGGDDGTLHSWSMTFVDNSPMPVLAYADTIICLSQVLEVSIDEYDSYLWSTGNNTQTADLFGNVLGLGTYDVSVTVDLNGCTGISNSFSLTVDACLGVEELGDLSIDVYPNPSNGQIVLDITGDSEGLMLEVMDMNGKRVYSESTGEFTSGLRKTVDLTNLANGMYFLKLDNGTSSSTKKIIKQ